VESTPGTRFAAGTYQQLEGKEAVTRVGTVGYLCAKALSKRNLTYSGGREKKIQWQRRSRREAAGAKSDYPGGISAGSIAGRGG